MKLYTVALLVIASITLNAQNIVFNDANFKAALIADSVDTDKDGEISMAEAAAIDTIDIVSGNVSSIDELGAFVNVSVLYLRINNLDSFPQFSFPKLKYLDLSKNKFKSLNISGFTVLKELYLNGNDSLKSVTMLGLDSLEIFNFTGTALKVIDFTGLSNLKIFSAGMQLDTLHCHGGYHIEHNTISRFSGIKYLDISNHPTQDKVWLSWQNFPVGFLMADNCPKLETVQFIYSAIGGVSFYNDTALKVVQMDKYTGSQSIKSIVESTPSLLNFSVGHREDYVNIGDTISIENHNKLEYLTIYNVNGIKVKGCGNIIEVQGRAPKCTVQDCPKYVSMQVSNLEEIIIDNCATFSTFPQGWSNTPLFAYSLKKVSITNCPSLETLVIAWYTSKINHLNLTGSTNLTQLSLGGMDLDTLDLSTNSKLTKLECLLNPIKNLDVSYLPDLTYLDCNTTSMKSLNLCFENRISHLNVSGHDSLFYVLVPDTNNVTIDVIIPSADSSKMLQQCQQIITGTTSLLAQENRQAIRAFNVIGELVPLNTRNAIIIIEYTDGTFEKTLVLY